MRVDVKARLGYGWMVACGDIPDSYYEDGAGHLDGIAKRLGQECADDMVCRANEYNEDSPVFVGILLSAKKQVGDDSIFKYHYEQKSPGELADDLLGFMYYTANMKRFYEKLIGKAPGIEPAMFLFENWR